MESKRAGLILQVVTVALLVVIAFELGQARPGNSSGDSSLATDVTTLQTEVQNLDRDVQLGNYLQQQTCEYTAAALPSQKPGALSGGGSDCGPSLRYPG